MRFRYAWLIGVYDNVQRVFVFRWARAHQDNRVDVGYDRSGKRRREAGRGVESGALPEHGESCHHRPVQRPRATSTDLSQPHASDTSETDDQLPHLRRRTGQLCDSCKVRKYNSAVALKETTANMCITRLDLLPYFSL